MFTEDEHAEFELETSKISPHPSFQEALINL
jgi:hypothetical protein